MKNNTKIRLHLSKNLFESVAREVLAESKKMNMSGGAYTEAVKMPKAKKSAEKMTNKMEKMEEVDAVGDTNKMRKMYEMSSKEKMAKGLYKEKKMDEMQVNVAEEDMLNEIDPGTIDWSVVAAGLGAIGIAPFLIDKIHNLWKKKFPKSFEKAQSLSKTIDRQASGNEPGDKDRQIKTGQFESTKLNELRKKNKNK